MDLSAVLVHYRTPTLLLEALDRLDAACRCWGGDAEWIVVDNGSEPGELAAAEERGARVVEPGENLGYAGGLALGVQSAAAPRLLFLNPDVLLAEDSLEPLLAALDSGVDAAGPRLFWDRACRFLLPPTEGYRALDLVLKSLAGRGEGWALRARRRWRGQARRHWQATAPIRSFRLSGCCLALRRESWERIGPFDAGYRLYFEETDWLDRLRRAGGRALHVPAAQAVHLYARSTIGEPRAARWFAESEERFLSRSCSRWVLRLRNALAPGTGRIDPPIPASDVLPQLPAAAGWCEVAGDGLGFPAAACRRPAGTEGAWRVPQPPGGAGDEAEGYVLRAVDESGRELMVRRWREPAAADARMPPSATP